MYGNPEFEVFRHADRLHAGVVQRRSASRGPSARRVAGGRSRRAPPYQDKQSGGRDDRVGLKTCLAGLRASDVLVVWKLDRLGRSLSHLVRILDDLKGRGVAFRSLTEGIDTTTSHGEFLYNLFGTLAQYERSLIRERVNAGLRLGRSLSWTRPRRCRSSRMRFGPHLRLH